MPKDIDKQKSQALFSVLGLQLPCQPFLISRIIYFLDKNPYM
jgi:hypothetical protein